jgi:release factor glutamine methyltransferase
MSTTTRSGDNNMDIVDMTGWTVDRVVALSTSVLKEHNVSEPHIAVSHLLAASMGLTWEAGYREIQSPTFRTTRSLTSDQAIDFSTKLRRRLQHEPLQYILGKWDFLDYTITVRPPLLCPRPETEELVMMIVAETTERPVHILDVGCGTGVIGLALADKLTDAFVQAIDVEPIAIETSLENSNLIFGKSQDIANSCYQAMLCSAENYEKPQQKYDIVVSNPPYIPRSDLNTLQRDVADYESHTALFGGPDGMSVVRSIVQKLTTWCNSGGVCWMEVDPSHPRLLREWIDSTPDLGVVFESSYKDIFGNERFVKIRVL